MSEKTLAEGFYFDKPRENAPEFVKGRISVNVPKAIPFLEKHANAKGYVDLDLLKSKEGKLYLQLNDFKPKQETEDEDKAF